MPAIVRTGPGGRDGRRGRFYSPWERFLPRTGGGNPQDGIFPLSDQSFVLPLTDLGSGAVRVTKAVGTGSVTFTRATQAAARLSSGLWNLAVASGTARSHYDPNGVYLGYLAEAAATQILTFPRDMTNAAWVKVGMTTAQTSTGIDGAANSCTRLTATVGGDTALETSTAAAINHTYSAYVKRVTGVGTITLKCAAATLDITALINTSTFTLVQMTDATLNAAVGFAITTIGDAIDVDCNQLETGLFASSPIPAAGTRNADVMTFPLAGNGNANSGSFYCEYQADHTFGTACTIFGTDNGTTAQFNYIGLTATNVGTYDGTTASVVQWAIPDATAYVANTAVKMAGRYQLNAAQEARNGTLGTPDVSATMPVSTTIVIGNSNAGAAQPGACIKNCRIWNSPLSNAQLQLITR